MYKIPLSGISKHYRFNIIKKIVLILSLSILFISCEKENQEILIGEWKLVKSYSVMGGDYFPDIQHQRIEEYTKDNIRIRYDFEGNEITRCNYSATNSTVTISGKELNGETWSLYYDYWFVHDKLKTTSSGEFDEFFIRVK